MTIIIKNKPQRRREIDMAKMMKEYPKRKSIRLKDYDYANSGWYFITICTNKHKFLFGKIKNNHTMAVGAQRAVPAVDVHGVCLNQFGKIVREEWENTQCLRKDIDLDEYIIMPNHFHGIMIIHESDTQQTITGTEITGTARCAPTTFYKGPISGSLSTIVRSFKSAVTKRINILRDTPQQPVWQRSFYDHIIRTDKSLQNIREYIINNPLTWDQDEYNPARNQALCASASLQ